MQEQKELIINEQEKEETKRLTFQKWLKGIGHYKWWIIGGTLVLGVAGALGTEFGINRITEKLTADYSYNLATITDEDGVERFVDGSLFNYADVVSKTNMENIKAQDEQFKSININKIIKNSAITVSRKAESTTGPNGTTVVNSKTVFYTITAKAKYFPNKEIGKKFVESLIYAPKLLSSNAIERYNVTSYLSDSFGSLSYLKKVQALQSQQKAIGTTYQKLDDKFGSYVIGNEKGETLAQISSDFESEASNVSVLANAFYANGYVDYISGQESQRISAIKEEAVANIKALESKQNEMEVAKDLLKTMQSATMISTLDSESEYSKELIKLKNQITNLSGELDSMIKDLHWAGYFANSDGEWAFDNTDTHNACYQLTTLDTTWVEKNAAFAEELSAAANSLENEKNEASESFKFMFNHYNNGVSVFNTGYVEVKGNVAWPIGLVVGLILGFVISSLITGEVEVYKKEEKK